MGMLMEIITDLIEAIILLSIFQIFMGEKRFVIKNKIKSIIFCLIFTTFLYISSTYITLMYHTLINIVFSIILLIFITKINAWAAASIYFIFYIILLITEMSVGTIEMLVLNTNMEQIVSNQKNFLVLAIMSKLLQILIVILLYQFNLSIKKYKVFNNDKSIYSNFIFSIAILGIFTVGICYSSSIRNNTNYNALIFVLYLTFFILSMRDLKERDRLINIKNKYQVQEFQIKNMEQIISIIREEKHDFSNHINVIQALCTLNKPNALERIREYVSSISELIHDSFKYLNTGNDYIDGLLSIKNNYAGKNEIDFSVVIDEPLSTLKIKADELISIVSNLVDNAFEAFDKSLNSENKKVIFETCLEEGKFIMEIADNAKVIPQNEIDSIFTKGFSTKTDKGSDHGFGLFITKELVEKNHGTISVESDEFETVFTVIFDLRRINS